MDSRSATANFGVAEASPSHFPPGYEILEKLGQGGMGVVYRARHERLRQIVALKMISSGGRAGTQEVERFISEARAVARLHHPNIVRIHEMGEHLGAPFFTLEYCAGGSLGKHLREREDAPISPGEAAGLVETLARAVAFAHRHGIVHRDLSPGNILLTVPDRNSTPPSLSGWIPKVADFGLAKNLDDGEARTVSGAILGTPGYLAPEQAAGGSKHIGPTADIYSLGAILYKLLTGRAPFKGPTAMDTMLQVVREDPVLPSRLQPGLPRDLETICLKCLSKDPDRRYPSAEALAEELERWRTGKPILARPAGYPERIWRWCRRNRAVASLGFLTVLLLVAGTITATTLAVWALGERRRAENNASRFRDQKTKADLARAQAESETRAANREREKARRSLADATLLRVGSFYRNHPDGAAALLDDESVFPRRARRAAWAFYRDYCRRRVRTISCRAISIAWKPGGETLAAVDRTGAVRLWQTDLALEVGTLPKNLPRAHMVAWKPDGTTLAIAGEDGSVRLVDPAVGRLLSTLPGKGGPVTSVAWNGSGDELRSFARDGTFTVWNVAAEKILSTSPGPPSSGAVFAWRGDGNCLAISRYFGTNRNKVQLYDPRTGEMPSSSTASGRAYNDLAWSPDGRNLAIVSHEGMVRVLDAESCSVAREWRGRNILPVRVVAWSLDGKTVATSGWDRRIHLWDPATGQETASLMGHEDEIETLAWSSRPGILATASRDGTIKIWNTALRQETGALVGHTDFVNGVAWSPDGKRLASASSDRTVKIWDIESRVAAATLPGHLKPVTSVAWNSQGTLLASGSSDGTVHLRDGISGEILARLTGHSNRILAVAWSPDGTLLASGAQDETCILWDVRQRKQRAVLQAKGLGVHCLAFGPQGKTLAAGAGNGTIQLWDVRTARTTRVFQGHRENVYSLAWSPDGSTLASGGKDQIVRIWEPTLGKVRTVLKGHTYSVRSLAWNCDGSILATGGWDRTIRLWNVTTGQLHATLTGHDDVVSGLAWSPDGNTLASGGDARINLWRVGEPESSGKTTQP